MTVNSPVSAAPCRLVAEYRRYLIEGAQSLERVIGINHKYWNHGNIKGDKSVITPFDIRNGVILTLEG